MSLNGNIVERAAKMLVANRYFPLATCSKAGPWCAPINYVIGPGHRLTFYSAPDSRHGVDLAASSTVSGAIYDSTATSSEVDGLQFLGDCRVIDDAELPKVHEHYFEVNFTDPAAREWFYREPQAFSSQGRHRFYEVVFRDVYVINYESMENERLDSRLEVPLAEMWSRIDELTS